MKEFFDSFTLADDGTWLVVPTVFKRKPIWLDGIPAPCEIPAPQVPAQARGRA